MTAPTTTILGLHQELAIQNQRLLELVESIARRVAADPDNAHAAGMALVGTGMNILSDLTRRTGGAGTPEVLRSMITVPQTEADVIHALTVQRDATATVIRELVALFTRMNWDLP